MTTTDIFCRDHSSTTACHAPCRVNHVLAIRGSPAVTWLTNVVSNNAAAAIGTPIAIGIAQQLGVSVEPFILAVLFGANMSFATPYGYQTNLLILSAGGYKFADFLRVGIPLTIIMWLGFSFVLPALYEL